MQKEVQGRELPVNQGEEGSHVRTVSLRGSFVEEVVPHYGGGVIENLGELVFIGDAVDDFLEEVCVVAAARFDQEFFGGSTLLVGREGTVNG